MFFRTLIGRILILTLLLFTVTLGTVTLLHIRREHHHITSSSTETAELILSVIERSVASSMSVGNTRDVQAILETVGGDPRLAGVRIFKVDGRIVKSSDPMELGRRVHPRELAIFERGETSNVFTSSTGEILGVIKPIYNGPRCYGCHGDKIKVIGILNVDYSLKDPRAQMFESSRFFGVSMLAMIVLLTAGILVIFVRFVRRPLQSVVDKMTLVEDGDLSATLDVQYQDEVGQLMTKFNSMTDRLRQAQETLQQCHYQQMERADRLASVGEMSAGIAHEIKNPLAAISGAITVLSDDFAEDDPRREVIAKILEQISRLDKAATDLLYFGKPGKPQFNWVNVNELLKQTLFFVAQHPESRNVNQIQELTRNLPPVWVDEKQLQQVFFNVVINAIQAMKTGGTLLIQSDLRDKEGRQVVRVLIGDSGPGISAEDIERIFQPFYTTKTQGTGLGLAICRQLMEQQGGEIRIASRLGEGTRVTIELPVKEQREE